MSNFDSFVQRILINSENNTSSNGVSKELTYQQAVSIAIRSNQLYNESVSHPNKRDFDRQINECYYQRSKELGHV